MNHGRPLRFLVLTVGGWTAIRVAMLWPAAAPLPALIRAIAPPAVADPIAAFAPPMPTHHAAERTVLKAPPHADRQPPALRRPRREPLPTFAPAPAAVQEVAPSLAIAPVQPPPLRPAPLATPPGRFAGSVWGIVRGGMGDALTGGQLGGSQVGARLTYALGNARRVALAARIATPLHGRGAEVGVGLDWQPTALPLHLIAEQRVPLGRGRGGPVLMVVGGVDPRPLPAGFRVEAYGQAGAIARGTVEGFADGALRITHGVAAIGATRFDLGIGSWGGAQRGAARLDLGPSIAVTLPVERRAVRLTLDWRQRVVGHARPGSGPALSIGGDF